jgi:hypothetical protein
MENGRALGELSTDGVNIPKRLAVVSVKPGGDGVTGGDESGRGREREGTRRGERRDYRGMGQRGARFSMHDRCLLRTLLGMTKVADS